MEKITKIDVAVTDLTALLLRRHGISDGVWYLVFETDSDPERPLLSRTAESDAPLLPSRALLVRHVAATPPPPSSVDATSLMGAGVGTLTVAERDYDHG